MAPPPRDSAAAHVIVMGVSGSGKTTVATLLAARLHYEFADGDAFHSRDNVAKMARGEPLTDADREPWLRAMATWIGDRHRAGRSTVLACSALQRKSRDTLRAAAPRHVRFVHLDAPKPVLVAHLRERRGHFMPPELLDSQLAALEPLEPDERGIVVDAADSPPEVLQRIVDRL